MEKHKEVNAESSANEKLQNMALNTNKAGMEGLDTAKINEIIQKASEGSKFYLHKQKRQEKLNERIEVMKKHLNKLSQDQIDKAEAEMTKIGAELSKARDMNNTIVHIDMDMFYAAVEMRDDPSLKTKPMAVGGKDMLSTSNYIARKFGVRAAMPGFIGLKLCPDLVIVPCNYSKYKAVSKEIEEIFEDYDPNFAMMSLDEAYLDVTEFVKKNHALYEKEDSDLSVAEEIVKEIRTKIEEKTSLTASAGIACNTRLAKVCSDMNKPNGQYYLPPKEESIMEFIDKLPIRKVCGIGGVSEQQLKALGIQTCSDLYKKRGLLRLLFTETSYMHFLRISLGLGSTVIEATAERERKSISNETTFKGTSDTKVLFKLCEDLCKDLQDHMERKEMVGKVFTLKLKDVEFQTRTRAHTLPEPTNESEVMISIAKKLLQNEIERCPSDKPLTLRLLGMRMSNLCYKSELSPKKQQTITGLFQKLKKGGEVPKPPPLKEKAPDPKKTGHASKKSFMQEFSSYKAYKAKVNGQPHTCLVCSQSLCFPSLNDFNDHFFKCLKAHCEGSNEESLSENSKLKSDADIASHFQKMDKNFTFNKETELIPKDVSGKVSAPQMTSNKTNLNSQKSTDDLFDDPEELAVAGPSTKIVDELTSKGIDYLDVSPPLNQFEDNDITIVQDEDSRSGEESIPCYQQPKSPTHVNKPLQVIIDDSSNSSDANEEKLLCPVCSTKKFSDNLSLNLHLDMCLNGSLVKELVHQSNCELDQNNSSLASTSRTNSKRTKRKLPSNKESNKQLKASSKVLYKFLGIS